MEEIIPTVNVRQLISAYERGIPSDNNRPRAASVGNILDKNVIVRSHNYQTLSDIEDALEIIEENLNRYQIYNKRKHVEFQEILFNLLTSVINIEPDINDAPVRKKNLISKTQKLVSVLNQKLPNSGTSVSTPVTKEADVQFLPSENTAVSLAKPSTTSELQHQILKNEYGTSVSVENLKQNFQTRTVENISTTILPSKKQESISVQTSTTSNVQNNQTPEPENLKSIPKPENPVTPSADPEMEEEEQKEKTPEEPISVRKLRNMFEEKEKENKTGLELIIKPKTFQYQVLVPYTAETLGTYRFFRANSGNYINETGGILNRINMTRATSTIELNSSTYKTFEEKDKGNSKEVKEDEGEEDSNSDVQSATSSQISRCDSLDSVKEKISEDYEVTEGKGNGTLLGTISVKGTREAFENMATDVEVHITTAEMSDVLKEYFVQDVLLNGSHEEIGITDVEIDTVALTEAEEEFENLLNTNESIA